MYKYVKKYLLYLPPDHEYYDEINNYDIHEIYNIYKAYVYIDKIEIMEFEYDISDRYDHTINLSKMFQISDIYTEEHNIYMKYNKNNYKQILYIIYDKTTTMDVFRLDCKYKMYLTFDDFNNNRKLKLFNMH